MQDRETRAYHAELRMEGGGDTGPTRIVGHAAVFDQLSEDLGGFREKIAAGTFSESIEADDVRALFNHSADYVLGRNKAGTLEMREDETGLLVEISPPNTQVARDLMVSIERGDVDQMSFAFRTIEDAWQHPESEGEPAIRTLRKVQLLDVSPVTYPAYPQTDVGVRSLREFLAAEERDVLQVAAIQRAAAERQHYLRKLRLA